MNENFCHACGEDEVVFCPSCFTNFLAQVLTEEEIEKVNKRLDDFILGKIKYDNTR